MKIRAVICLWVLLVTDAICADNSALTSFARNNAEKFKNEIVETKGVALGTRITVQGVLDSSDIYGLHPKYDVETGEMLIGGTFRSFMFLQSIKHKGSFLGKNAFGAKTTVSRDAYERFFVRNGDLMEVDLEGTRVKMSPSQFRTINKLGIRAEVDLILGHPNEDVVVKFSDTIEAATIHFPVEGHMKVWTVYGRFEEIRWFLPGEKQATLVWER